MPSYGTRVEMNISSSWKLTEVIFRYFKSSTLASSQGALPDVCLDGGEELRELVDAVPGQDVGELAAEEPALLRPLHVRLDLGANGSDVRRGLEMGMREIVIVFLGVHNLRFFFQRADTSAFKLHTLKFS